MTILAEVLDGFTTAGELFEPGADGAVRCVACAHRCLIRPGRRGICQVRFNDNGELRVPWGYVAALQSDPIEKKPFSHVLPSANALTFGMLGCDFHCPYCFTGDTQVITGEGPKPLSDCFDLCERFERRVDGETGYPADLYAISASGARRKVKAVFKHAYQGDLKVITPYYLPALKCTPDHKVFAADDVGVEPVLTRAAELSKKSYLAVPKHHSFSVPQVVDVLSVLSTHHIEYQIPWKLSDDQIQTVMTETEQGRSSQEIGAKLGLDPSYVRHIRSKYRRGKIKKTIVEGALVNGGLVRFPNEHKPGIPAHLPLTEEFARLLGLYCAEGSVVKSKDRPNSLTITFNFSPQEFGFADETVQLLKHCLGVDAQVVKRQTTLGVSVMKASAGLLLKSLAGGKAQDKHVPAQIFNAPRNVAKAFLDAYVAGDGHCYPNGKVTITTVSSSLAYGIAWLALKLGCLPSIYPAKMPNTATIQGRTVNRAPYQYTVVWYKDNASRARMVETEKFYLVPIKEIETEPFEGDVFNIEVEQEHNYLAGFFAVSNCQNWLTSQAGRDPEAEASVNLIRKITPEQMVEYARRVRAEVVVSSYNEPLITSEWAVGIFKQARAAGLKCAFVSNGNATPEALAYLRPYLDAYKVDLKSMQAKNYRQLGGVLKHVLETIQKAHELGLWVEVVTLVIPGFNDSNDELWDAARFLARVSPDIPWHVTAFHKDYHMTDPENTPAKTLLRAAEIGREAGLRYVYAGNLPGMVDEYEDTHCPQCNMVLVKRRAYVIREYHITSNGTCPKCGAKIPGVWPEDPDRVTLNGYGFPLPVY